MRIDLHKIFDPFVQLFRKSPETNNQEIPFSERIKSMVASVKESVVKTKTTIALHVDNALKKLSEGFQALKDKICARFSREKNVSTSNSSIEPSRSSEKPVLDARTIREMYVPAKYAFTFSKLQVHHKGENTKKHQRLSQIFDIEVTAPAHQTALKETVNYFTKLREGLNSGDVAADEGEKLREHIAIDFVRAVFGTMNDDYDGEFLSEHITSHFDKFHRDDLMFLVEAARYEKNHHNKPLVILKWFMVETWLQIHRLEALNIKDCTCSNDTRIKQYREVIEVVKADTFTAIEVIEEQLNPMQANIIPVRFTDMVVEEKSSKEAVTDTSKEEDSDRDDETYSTLVNT